MIDYVNRYAYRVEWSVEDQEHVGLCTEFPSLSWLAETPEEAFGGIRSLVAEVVEDMKSNGEVLPEPLASRRYSGKIHLRTTPEFHRILTMRAAEDNVSLNRYLNSKISSVL